MPITYIKAVAATLTNNTKTITVTGEQVDFSKANDYLVALDNGLYVLAVASGTAPDVNGDSTLTLVDTWLGATLSNKSLLIFPTFAKIYESVAAMTALNDVTRGILTKLQSLLTDTNPTLDIAVGQTSTITTVPYGYLTNQVTALITQLNDLVVSVQAMTKPEFDRNRLNELNNFPVSGHLKVDKATGFEFQQIAGWENKFKIKASETKIDGVWYKYADTTITNFDAPNGLQNKDLVTADFADLTAAIVAGGTSLSQSYLSQRVVVYAMQEDIVAAPAQSTAYIQDPTNNFYADDGVLRQRVMTFETERFLETVEQKTGQLFTNSVNAMTSLGWTLSANTLGEFEKAGKKAVVFGIVNSRNQGGGNPSVNPDGTRKFFQSSIDGGHAQWYSTDFNITSISECLDIGATNANKSPSSTGNIGGTSGHKSGKFHDAVESGDFEDCRMSALKTPKAELRETHKRRAIAGQVEGVEGVPFTKIQSKPSTSSNAAGTSFQTDDTSPFEIGDIVHVTDLLGNILVVDAVINAIATDIGIVWGDASKTYNRVSGTVYLCVYTEVKIHAQTNPTWTGIVGDPVEIDKLFTTVGSKFYGADGIEGEWIGVIPDGIIDNFPLQRKSLSDTVTRTYTSDAGVTWISQTGGYANTTANEFIFTNSPAANVFLIHYETQAHFTKDAVNSKKLDLGGVWASNQALYDFGNILTSSLIGKINTNGGSNWQVDTNINGILIRPDTGIINTGDNDQKPSHSPINLSAASSNQAIKVLDYLSSSNNVGQFMMLYKEMIFYSGLDLGNEAVIATGAQVYTQGVTYRFNSSAFGKMNGRYVICTQTTGSLSEATIAFLVNRPDGTYVDFGTGAEYFKDWNGTGWGDNNTFEPVDNQESFTDDNGQTGVLGMALTEMQHFIIEE